MSELRDIRIVLIGGAEIVVPECPPGLVEQIVDGLCVALRGRADPLYTINRMLEGPQIIDATKIVVIEVRGGPGLGRWALDA